MYLLGIYFNVNLILVLISVVLTVVVLNFHYRGPKKSRVPRWCRRLIMGKIGPWLGFHFVYHDEHHTPMKAITQKENTNGDVTRKRHDSKSKASIAKTPPMRTTMNDSNEQSAEAALTEHSITHNIEQILLKMQTEFDPAKIEDENLKISILHEILECQRLLLSIHAKKQNVQSHALHDIYEEWKILAIIVDRICFIFYLISMIAASIIFFVREPILKRNG